MNQMYGFKDEVKSKYTAQMADLFTEVYNWLPLAHCINKRVLVMHGGLFSRDGVTLDEIRGTDRNRQPPEEGRYQYSTIDFKWTIWLMQLILHFRHYVWIIVVRSATYDGASPE